MAVVYDARRKQSGGPKSNSVRQTHPVGQKEASRFGLYDLHGKLFLSTSGTKPARIQNKQVNSRIHVRDKPYVNYQYDGASTTCPYLDEAVRTENLNAWPRRNSIEPRNVWPLKEGSGK